MHFIKEQQEVESVGFTTNQYTQNPDYSKFRTVGITYDWKRGNTESATYWEWK